ncbi:MAG TPA: POTRA domain-containing protein, partial [Bacteroidia bacterium]|nr:POTRA domain-containing protein [Bacteroidia bacterium]
MPKIILFLLFAFIIDPARAQTGSVMSGDTNVISYANPKEYTLVDVYVSGCRNIDSNVVRLISGLPIGDKITVPGEKTSAAIDKIWKEGLFEDIWLEVAKVEGAYIWLRFVVVEKPNILVPKEGLLIVRPGGKKIKKSEREDIEEKLRLRGEVFTEYKRQQIIQIVNEHYIDDGYINCKTTVEAIPFDTGGRFVQLKITIDKGKKVRIEEILIAGNQEFKKGKIKRMMKDTKEKHWWNPFKQSKFLQDNYDTDKQKVLAKYRSKGYRDVRFAIDSVQRLSENRVRIHLNIVEGRKYKFGTITWVGNTKYSSKYLTDMLGIKPGETYNEELFDSRLYMSAQGNDISSLYMDQGYLFFQINPVEVRIHGDTIDYEMRIYEGRPATIRNV